MNLISILTPTHNRAGNFLPDTIRRVQNQKENGFEHEHIIIDNASTDGTEEMVKQFMQNDNRIKYIRNEKNLWASGALNKGFENSSGEIIVPLDDDDLLPKNSLQMRFNALQNKSIQWCSGYAVFIDENNRLLDTDKKTEYESSATMFLDDNNALKEPYRFFLGFFKNYGMICNGTVSIRRKCIEDVGGWNNDFTASQDTDMWIKLAKKEFHYKLLNNYLLFYRIHQGQSSNKNSQNGIWESLAKKLKDEYNISYELLDKYFPELND